MKNKKIIFYAMFFILTFTLSGCGTSNKPQDVSNINVVSVASSTTAAISIANFTFNPITLTVKKGTVVTWSNNDLMPHQIKTDIFDSSILSKGQDFSFTFNEVGNFNYYCTIHPSMTGQIIVE